MNNSDNKPVNKNKMEIGKKINNETSKITIVGIGASAGGLEALQSTLPYLPENLNYAYVILQHLDPRHKSLMRQLLAPNTTLPVVEMKNNQLIEPNHVYITPPNSNVILNNGRFQLSKPLSSIGPKPSIDLFFKYLAEEMKENAIGIILSGTGSDGSSGIRAIKAGGGITLVQDEKTAKFNGMPRAAINTGSIDLILPPEEIGERISQLNSFRQKRTFDDIDVKDDEKKVLEIISNRTGANFNDYKPYTIQRRIYRRMAILKIEKLNMYIDFLKHNTDEVINLYNDLLISVTSFFRDKDAFLSLEKLFSKYLKSKENQDIRVWVAGCATGEEAFSIAIMLDTILEEDIFKYNIQIFATDLDETAISYARLAKYSVASLDRIDKSLLEKYFIRERDTYRIIPRIREMVIFAKHDLTKEPPFSKIDLISCRNLLIYFNDHLQSIILPVFHYSLVQNGILFLGKSENTSAMTDLFSVSNKKWKIYRKRSVRIDNTPELHLKATQHWQTQIEKNKIDSKSLSIRELLNDTIVDLLNTRVVVINDSLHIIHTLGNLDGYLKWGSGNFDNNILNFINEDLKLELRTAIYKSMRETTKYESRIIKTSIDDNIKHIKIIVQPMSFGIENANDTSVILFSELNSLDDFQNKEVTVPSMEDPRIKELEEELMSTKEHLQTTIEELETSNEELQSTTEELQSSNEELQSSNEELETSNEELQSTNEELNTVNEELNIKSSELVGTVNDLENILAIIGKAIIVVDNNLRITRFNELACDIFELSIGDEKRVLTSIRNILPITNLKEKLMQVIEKRKTIDNEVSHNNKSYWIRIVPYVNNDNVVSGAILMFYDQTHLKKVEKALRSSEERFKLAMMGSNEGIWDWNIVDDTVYFSKRWKEIIGYNDDEIKEDIDEFKKRIHPEDQDDVWKRILKHLDSSEQLLELKFRLKHKENNYIWIQSKGIAIRDDNRNAIRFVGTHTDITEQIWTSDLYRAMVDNTKQGFIIIQNNRIVFSNSAFHNLSGYSGDELHRMDSRKVKTLFFIDVDKDIKNLENELQNKNIDSLMLNCKDDSTKWLDVHLSMIDYHGEAAIQLTLNDITGRIKAEEALIEKQTQLAHAGRLTSLGEMATGIAHELNQPLAIIEAHAESLKLSIKDMKETYLDDISSIIEEVHRAANIIEQMRSYARTSIPITENIDITRPIKNSLTFFREQFKHHNIYLEEHYDDIPYINVNSQHIEQIMVNFLSNARYAVDMMGEKQSEGYIKKIIIKVYHDKKRSKVVLEVNDNGVGMTDDEKDRCFEPFFTTKEVGKGTGLGLSIVYNFLKDMDGSIDIHSQKYKGTYITVLFNVSE